MAQIIDFTTARQHTATRTAQKQVRYFITIDARAETGSVARDLGENALGVMIFANTVKEAEIMLRQKAAVYGAVTV